MVLEEHHLFQPKHEGQRRLLALDGGGIRGLIALGILERLESDLRSALQAGEDFRLSDYFDFIGGTSTGAILATGLSKGLSVEELIDFYTSAGADMFKKNWLLGKAWSKYRAEPLKAKLQQVLGADTQFGSDKLRTLLMLVLRNSTTDSPWPLSNNPLAKYNDRSRPDCNLLLPLWQLVRASTAAPTYFPPEVIDLDSNRFVFVDGGVTPYNNPAFMMFRMAISSPFRLNWATGEDRMLLISIGTGENPNEGPKAEKPIRHLIANAMNIAPEMMNGMAYDQDVNCRTVGRCVFGAPLDSEIDDLIPDSPTKESFPRSFLYARYSPPLTASGLTELGFSDADVKGLRKMDSITHMGELLEIGRAYADRHVDVKAHFGRFLN